MNIQYINDSIAPEREILLTHPLYHKIQNIYDVQCFLQTHVYAVWDFMSLLKALQIQLTCNEVPWIPVGNPEIRYLINEIVLAEETDINKEGHRQSHYEMYLDAMVDCGVSISKINYFVSQMKLSKDIFQVIQTSPLRVQVKTFLEFTFGIIKRGKLHEIAAAFTFGREDLIPSMFPEILKNLQVHFPKTNLAKLIYYFERHVVLDQDEHGPMALQMVKELCGEDREKWNDVVQVSKQALEVRVGLWDAILQDIEQGV